MKITIVCLPLVLLLLSCSQKTDVTGTGATATGPHETAAAPALGERSWTKRQGFDWENIRTWVPGVDKSIWQASQASGGWAATAGVSDSSRYSTFKGCPTVEEPFWDTKQENLEALPPVVIIRPTQYAEFSTVSDRSFTTGVSKIVGHRLSLPVLLWVAYAIDLPRMILPSNMPAGRFDVMLTLHENQREALQKAIQYDFGLTGRRETIQTNALLLKVKDPRLLAIHVCDAGTKEVFTQKFKYGTNLWVWSGFPMSTLSDFLESTIFLKPIVVQQDLSRRYTISLQWDDHCDSKYLKEHVQREMLDQLAAQGLELVPVREPIEMLTVENAGQPK